MQYIDRIDVMEGTFNKMNSDFKQCDEISQN